MQYRVRHIFECIVFNRWKEELDNKVRGPDGSPLPCFLLANKVNKSFHSQKDNILHNGIGSLITILCCVGA